jgi:hypothetical protein
MNSQQSSVQLTYSQRVKNAAKVSTKFSAFIQIGLLAIFPSLTRKEKLTYRRMLDHHVLSSRLRDTLGIRSQGLEKFAISVLGKSSKKRGVNGNLAGLEFLPHFGPTWGRGIVGASPKAVNWLANSVFRKVSVPIDFKVYETAAGRNQDSEYLLITALTHYLKVSGEVKEQTMGHAILMTETLPCISCAGVIQQFTKRYPKITMTVAFLLPTQDDEDDDRQSQFAAALVDGNEHNKLLRLEVVQDKDKKERLVWNCVKAFQPGY